jgi:hypothetical protein
MKITSYISILLLFFVGFSACTKDFEEMNTDPNSPALNQADPGMMLTNAIESMTDRVHEIFLGHEMGSCWAQHMAKVQYTDEDRYIPRVSVINTTWTSFYAASGNDVKTIYDVAVASENENFQGVALVLKCYITSVLTDLFGDIPYTQAWQGVSDEAILLPAYDSQESIYRDLIAQLATANTLLDPDGDAISGDILYNNDILSWKKFANSLRMRLLLRMSGRDASFVTTEMTAMFNAPDTYPVFTSNAEHAALPYLGSAPNNNPINENRKTRDDHRVSKTLVDLMWVDPVVEPDYRIFAYAEPADGTSAIEGLPNGLLSATAGGYLGNGIANTSKIGSYFSEATAPGMLMSYAELQFILAEAAHKGYIPGGEAAAEAYYVEGITASHLQFATSIAAGIGNFYGYPEDFFMPGTGDPGTDPLVWFLADGGWVYNTSIAMEQIATQKWVAMFDQGLQSWFEWRRTGYPVLEPAADGVLGGAIPTRAFYPSDEYARNSANVSAAVSSQGITDNLTSRVWWDID